MRIKNKQLPGAWIKSYSAFSLSYLTACIIKQTARMKAISCGYCEIFNDMFFYRAPPVAASDSPARLQ